MRNNLKHLLLGMSLGAVVVFIYGVNKLAPFAEKQTQTQENTVSTETRKVSIEELLKPKLSSNISVSFDKQIQYIEVNNLLDINTKKENEIDPQAGINNDSIEEIMNPKVSLYIYEKPETDVQAIAFDQLQTPFDLKEDNQSPTPTSEQTPTPKQNAVYSVVTRSTTDLQTDQNLKAPQDIITLIEKYAGEYGIDKNMMIGIAKCESGFRENAVNGPYAGIYQFVSGTWVSNRRAMGLDENLDLRYNAEESVRTAAFKMSRDGFGAWPVCQHKAQGLVASTQ